MIGDLVKKTKMRLLIFILIGVFSCAASSAKPDAGKMINITLQKLEARDDADPESLTGVTVVGLVLKPGLLKTDDEISVREAVLRAGGLSRLAFPLEVIIVTRAPRTRLVVRFPGDLSADYRNFMLDRIMLRKGDSLFVPEIMD
jgi:hypothetical protein